MSAPEKPNQDRTAFVPPPSRVRSPSSGEATEAIDPADRETLAEPAAQRALAAADQAPAQLPQQVGRYGVKGELGVGGMGQVLRGLDGELRREVAVKLLPEHADERAEAKFVAEAQITGQLEHPNIVPVHELGRAGDRLYFTMRRVEGSELGALLRSDQAPPLSRGLQLFLKICEAVDYAHSRGVIHRDLKPANVMIGPFGEVQVMDWGLAKVVGEAEQRSQTVELPADGDGTLQTLDGAIMGTPAYMPPEQANGEIERLDARSDVYALGAILYELLTGRPPYVGETALEVLQQVVAGPPQPPRQRAPEREVPWELEAVVSKAMAQAPEDRYPSVAPLRADIEAFLDDRLLSAARYSTGQRLGRWLRANRWRLLLAALLIGLTVGGLRSELQRRQRLAEAAAERSAFEQAEARGDWAAAELAGRRALDLEADGALEARVQAASEARRAQDAELARQAALRALDQRLQPLVERVDGARLWRYLPRIDLDAHHADLRQAVVALEGLLADPAVAGEARPWLLLGRARLELGRRRGGAQALRRANALDAAAGRRELATMALHRATLATLRWAEPGQQAIRRAAMAEAAAWLEGVELAEDSVTRVVFRGLSAVQRDGDIARAMAVVVPVLAQRPHELGMEEVWLLRAVMEMSDRMLARASLDQAIARCPQSGVAHMLRAHLTDAPLERMALLDRAIALEPELVLAYVWRSGSRMRAGDLVGARQDGERVLELDPDEHLGVVALARCDLQANDEAAAERRLATLEGGPNEGAAHFWRGVIHEKNERLEDALASFDKALTLHPEYTNWLSRRAELLVSLGRYQRAKLDLDAVVANRKSAWAHYQRSVVHERLGDRARANRDAGLAVALAPSNPRYRLNRATQHLIDARLDKADADLRWLLAAEEGGVLVRIGVAICAQLQGDKARARALLLEGQRREPDDPYLALWLTAFDGDSDRLQALAAKTSWLALIARCWRGQITPAQLRGAALPVQLSASERASRLAQVEGMLGIIHEQRGEPALARAAYRAAVADGAPSSFQRFWSRVRLRQLGD